MTTILHGQCNVDDIIFEYNIQKISRVGRNCYSRRVRPPTVQLCRADTWREQEIPKAGSLGNKI